MQFHKAEKFITGLLQTRLSSTLFYHDFGHTMYIVNTAMEIAEHEEITDVRELSMLKTAALFHDCGFVNTYHDHEEAGCHIAKDNLPQFGYTSEEIEIICNMIMATKSPPDPKTHLEKILCDADLFYLGTDEFEAIGRKLYHEWKEIGKVSSEKEWCDLQILFLQSHKYWTQTAVKLCEKKKTEHLNELLKKKSLQGND